MTVHGHRAGFFAGDHQLGTDAGRYVDAGVARGEPVLVIATAPHRALIEAGSGRSAGADFTWLDAGATLSSLLAGGVPDRERFSAALGELVQSLAAGGRVRAYGEMVALLWQRGDVPGAMVLESVWNELTQELGFDMLCGYPAAALATADLHELHRMCHQHSAFSTPEASCPSTERVGAPAELARSRVFLPAPQAVRATRHFVADALTDLGHDDLVADGTLIVSELATNAVIHGHSPFRASVRDTTGTVTIEVEDASAELPRRSSRPVHGIGGRGIAIVENVARRSGCRRLGASKVSWAELAAG